MTVCVTGWSHSKFGKLSGQSVEDLIVEAGSNALIDAGVSAADIDAIYVGTFNAGMVRQDFAASLALSIHPDLRFKPSTRVENACATGSAAIHQAINLIESRKARRVLVIGV